jgi:hypothetical protein
VEGAALQREGARLELLDVEEPGHQAQDLVPGHAGVVQEAAAAVVLLHGREALEGAQRRKDDHHR